MPEPILLNCDIEECNNGYVSIIGINPKSTNIARLRFESVPSNVVDDLKQAKQNQEYVDFEIEKDVGAFVVKKGTKSILGYEGETILIKQGTLKFTSRHVDISPTHQHAYIRLPKAQAKGLVRKQCTICGFTPRYE